MELIEQIGYDIIYYEISEEECNDKYAKKLNSSLIKYLSCLQKFCKK
jgi:hypothetical protein